MLRKIRDINATRTSGSGELYALPKATERAIPVVATAQFVVESRRVRQILLRYISPLYRWASIPSSAALNGFFGGSATLMSLPPVKVRHEVRKGTTARKVKNRQIGCQCHSDRIHRFLPKNRNGFKRRLRGLHSAAILRDDPASGASTTSSWGDPGRQFKSTLLCRCKL